MKTRAILAVLGIIILCICSAGFRQARVETKLENLWVEKGGRLDAELEYIDKHRGKNSALRIDDVPCPTCRGGVSSASGGISSTSQACPTPPAAPSSPATSSPSPVGSSFSPSPSSGLNMSATPSPAPTASTTADLEGNTLEILITSVDSSEASTNMLSSTPRQDYFQMMPHINTLTVCFAGDGLSKREVDCPTQTCTSGDDCPVDGNCGGDGRCVASLDTNLVSFSWQDVCARITLSGAFEQFSSVIPCTRATVLDCFSQGAFDWSQLLMLALPQLVSDPTIGPILTNDFGITGFSSLPDFLQSSDDAVGAAMTGGCRGYATTAEVMRWHESLIIGNPERGSDGLVDSVEAFQDVLLLRKPDVLHRQFATSIDAATAELVLDAWRTKLTSIADDHKIASSDEQRQFGSIKVSVLRSDAIADAVADVSDSNLTLSGVGLLLMLTFVIISLVDSPCTNHRPCGRGMADLGTLGVLLVVLATLSALGFCCWLGVPFNPNTLQVLPFLALGLGVDDMFIMLHCYASACDDWANEFSEGKRPLEYARVVGNALSRAGPSISMTSMANFVAFLIGSLVPLPAVSGFCAMAAAVVAFNYVFVLIGLGLGMAYHVRLLDRKSQAVCIDVDDSRATRCINGYTDILLRRSSRLVVFLVAVALCVASAYLISTIEDGQQIEDVSPRDSHLARWVADKFKFFSSFDALIVTKDFDYACRQDEFVHFLDALRNNTKWVAWVQKSWLESLQEYTAKSISGVQPLPSGACPASQFYETLDAWSSDAGSALDVLSAQKHEFGANAGGDITFTQTTFTLKNLVTTDDYRNMIADVRALFEDAEETGIVAFPSGVPFTYWEQFINLRTLFWQNMGVVFAVLCVVVVPFVVNPLASVIIVFVIAMITCEIFGLMAAIGIKFSAIPAVSLIMSVGISVEFVAHLVLCFLMELHGSRASGGLSTFFAILLLGFSKFEFVRKYFFAVWMLVVVIGLFNGLVFLPVLLSCVGPTALEFCPSVGCGGTRPAGGNSDSLHQHHEQSAVPIPARNRQTPRVSIQDCEIQTSVEL